MSEYYKQFFYMCLILIFTEKKEEEKITSGTRVELTLRLSYFPTINELIKLTN